MATPSKRRREGREAYSRGEDPDTLCPYKDGTWLEQSYRDDWMDGWKEQEEKEKLERAESESFMDRLTDFLGDSEGQTTEEIRLELIEEGVDIDGMIEEIKTLVNRKIKEAKEEQ